MNEYDFEYVLESCSFSLQYWTESRPKLSTEDLFRLKQAIEKDWWESIKDNSGIK